MHGEELLLSPHCIMAIDPGMSGAVCVLGRGVFQVRRDFKSLVALAAAIKELSPFADSASIEFVHSRPGEGSVSCFTFGRSAGVAFGALFSEGFGVVKPLDEVPPQTWQAYFRQHFHLQKQAPFVSCEIAAKILPMSSPCLSRVKDHNTADSILIAAHRLMLGPLSMSRSLTKNLLSS